MVSQSIPRESTQVPFNSIIFKILKLTSNNENKIGEAKQNIQLLINENIKQLETKDNEIINSMEIKKVKVQLIFC